MCTAADPATLLKLKQEEEERARLEARAQGTPVNERTFAEWRRKFDAEKAAKREESGEAAAEAEKALKISGRQWFMERDARPEVGGLGDDESGSDESGSDFEDDDDEDEDFLDDYLEEKADT